MKRFRRFLAVLLLTATALTVGYLAFTGSRLATETEGRYVQNADN